MITVDDIRAAMGSMRNQSHPTPHQHVVHPKYGNRRLDLTGRPDVVTRCAACFAYIGLTAPTTKEPT